MAWLSSRVLRALSVLTALVSLVMQAVALCSNYWLYSEELMENPNYNGTGEGEFQSKFTVSGLWNLCYNEPGKDSIECLRIDYFPKEEYSPDPKDSTMAIPYAVKRAAIFIFSSTLVLIIGEFLSVFGLILTRRRVLTFASGIAFILSGLLILMGMVIYISTFKAEVGNKLRPKSSFQGPLFIYHYGYSFLLAVTGLMTSEMAGTFAIFLYIKKYEEDAKKREDTIKVEEDHVPCPRHPSSGTLRWGEPSPRGSPGPESFLPRRGLPFRHSTLQQSESMKDLAFCSFPPFSRDTTFNTVSTSADFAREYSHEFSFDTLRRTTPV